MRHPLKKYTFFIAIIALFVLTASFSASAAQSNINRQQLREELIKLLKEEPDLVLNILRENSEVVLDVAQQGADQRRLTSLTTQWKKDMTQPKSAKLVGRPTLGSDKAPVTIVAFTDFTCMYCQQGEKTLQNIYESYNGKVRIVYKSLPMATHPGSVEAAQFMLAAWQQDKTKAWKLFHNLFNNRDRILANDGHAFMRSAAMEAGLNMTKLLDDAKSSKIQQLLDEDEQDADILKFQGTPSFMINNITIRGALQENLFRQAVDMALAEAEKKK